MKDKITRATSRAPGKTDFRRLRRMRDREIDDSDILQLRRGEKSRSAIQGFGSLLPFSTNLQIIRYTSRWRKSGCEDHSAIKNWEIMLDGSVNITEAGILSSTTEKYVEGPISVQVVAPSSVEGSEGISVCTVELHHWINSQPPGEIVHAICLTHGHEGGEGILLREVTPNSRAFVKLGNYIVIDRIQRAVPVSQKVCWRVL